MTTGTGGTDVKRMLAYESTPETFSAAGSTPATFSAAGSTRAAPFGANATRYDISIDALIARQGYVQKLVEKANALLATAHEAFVEGASCSGDCAGMQAIQGWVGRLVTEDERLDIEIRRFREVEGAKTKKKPR